MKAIEQNTCVRFKRIFPRKKNSYIAIDNENGECTSFVGKIGGRQLLNLNPEECMAHSMIHHEIIQALGERVSQLKSTYTSIAFIL